MDNGDLRQMTELFVKALHIGEDTLPVGAITHHQHVLDFQKGTYAVVSKITIFLVEIFQHIEIKRKPTRQL